MSYAEAKKLKIGQRVRFLAMNDEAAGTITEKNCMAAKIKWDDGQIGIIHLRDMQDVAMLAT